MCDILCLQYCEYYPDYEKCKAWLEKNLPDEFSKVKIGDATTEDAAGEDKKKSQRRGGKGMMKAKKTKEDGPKKVCVSRAPRGKKKSVTVVTGLSTFGMFFISILDDLFQTTYQQLINNMCFHFNYRNRPQSSCQILRYEIRLWFISDRRRRNRYPGWC